MKDLFIKGGPFFMGILTILLIATVAWFIYHFFVAYHSKQTDKTVLLRMLGYGKLIGLFALITGITGQLIGFTAMFHAIEQAVANGDQIKPVLVYGGIKVTIIVTMYGMLIYLLSLLLFFVSSILIEKKKNKPVSV